MFELSSRLAPCVSPVLWSPALCSVATPSAILSSHAEQTLNLKLEGLVITSPYTHCHRLCGLLNVHVAVHVLPTLCFLFLSHLSLLDSLNLVFTTFLALSASNCFKFRAASVFIYTNHVSREIDIQDIPNLPRDNGHPEPLGPWVAPNYHVCLSWFFEPFRCRAIPFLTRCRNIFNAGTHDQ
jgi:hypothetical protein